MFIKLSSICDWIWEKGPYGVKGQQLQLTIDSASDDFDLPPAKKEQVGLGAGFQFSFCSGVAPLDLLAYGYFGQSLHIYGVLKLVEKNYEWSTIKDTLAETDKLKGHENSFGPETPPAQS